MIDLIIIVVGIVLLIKGADTLVSSSIKITKIIKIPAFIVGFFIISLGTSAPEAAIGVISALEGFNQITLGDVIGSNIVNISIVLGITSLIVPVHISSKTTKKEIPMLIGIELLLVTLAIIGSQLSRLDGIILFIVFVVFTTITFLRRRNMKKRKIEKEEIEYIRGEREFIEEFADDGAVRSKREPLSKAIIFFIIGLIVLILGANMVVNSGVAIARILGLNESVIGLTIIAFGTSLPELVSSIIAVRKKEEDIAVGNLIGSSVFNILFVLALSVMINPIKIYGFGIMSDMLAMIILTIILLIFAYLFKKIARTTGLILIFYYISYIGFKLYSLI